jgi:hypothetical protein
VSIGFIGSNGKYAFTRYVPLGYWFLGGNLALLSFTSSHLIIEQTSSLIVLDFALYPNFIAPSTNHYTLDHVFNFSDSQAYIAGIPAFSAVIVDLAYAPGEYSPRIRVNNGFSSGSDLFVSLVQPSSPWYVRP